MKALVMTKYRLLEYRDVPDPEIGPHDVLIEVKACGICGSDVHGLTGETGRRLPPIIMGHEASGIVASVGVEVKDWQPGDRICIDSTIYCRDCYYCQRGLFNLCDNRRVLGVSCEDYRQDGAFAEYIAVPEHILYRLPEELSFERAALLEPLSVAAHAVNRTPIMLNDAALVVGAGVIGLLVIQCLRAAGCGRIIAVDLDRDRLELARRLGADLVFAADSPNIFAQVKDLTEGRGADICVDAVGITPSLNTALQCVRKGGTVTLVGNLAAEVEFPLQSCVVRELSVNASYTSRGEYPSCLEIISRGVVKVDPLVSATAPLCDGHTWFERLLNREPGLMKVILKP